MHVISSEKKSNLSDDAAVVHDRGWWRIDSILASKFSTLVWQRSIYHLILRVCTPPQPLYRLNYPHDGSMLALVRVDKTVYYEETACVEVNAPAHITIINPFCSVPKWRQWLTDLMPGFLTDHFFSFFIFWILNWFSSFEKTELKWVNHV